MYHSMDDIGGSDPIVQCNKDTVNSFKSPNVQKVPSTDCYMGNKTHLIWMVRIWYHKVSSLIQFLRKTRVAKAVTKIQ